jgi:hypothetical protein
MPLYVQTGIPKALALLTDAERYSQHIVICLFQVHHITIIKCGR